MDHKQKFSLNQNTHPGAALTACAMLCGSLAAAVRRQNARRPQRGVGAENVARRAEGPVLTLGTRGSPLALAQAYEAKRRLGEARSGNAFKREPVLNWRKLGGGKIQTDHKEGLRWSLDLRMFFFCNLVAALGRPSQNWLVTMLWKSESFRPQAKLLRMVEMCDSCFFWGMAGGYVPRKLKRSLVFILKQSSFFVFPLSRFLLTKSFW